jgi:hypothetical protein
MELSGWGLSERLREHGWHCIRPTGEFSIVRLGRTAESASCGAIEAGLNALPNSFNAAEIDSLRVANYKGFHVARVALYALHIQRDAILSPPGYRVKESYAS